MTGRATSDRAAEVDALAKWLHDRYASWGPTWDNATEPLAEWMRQGWREHAREALAVVEEAAR